MEIQLNSILLNPIIEEISYEKLRHEFGSVLDALNFHLFQISQKKDALALVFQSKEELYQVVELDRRTLLNLATEIRRVLDPTPLDRIETLLEKLVQDKASDDQP